MWDLFDLNRRLSSGSNADPADVLNVKQGLADLGFYRMPEYGLTDMPDTGLFESVKAFQRRHGLTVDGYMEPGGETVTKLNDELAASSGAAGNRDPEPDAANPRGGSRAGPQVGLLGAPIETEPAPRPIQVTPPKVQKPWWQSGRIGQASAAANFHNGNAVHAMLGYGDNGDMPKWYAGAIKDGGAAKTVAEVADFMNQLHRRDPARAQRFNEQVWDMLGPEGRAKVMQVAGMAEGPGGIQLAEGKQPWQGGADPNTGLIPIPNEGKRGGKPLPPIVERPKSPAAPDVPGGKPIDVPEPWPQIDTEHEPGSIFGVRSGRWVRLRPDQLTPAELKEVFRQRKRNR